MKLDIHRNSSRRSGRLAGALATAALLLAGTVAMAAPSDLKPFSADYEASYMGLNADARMTLAQTGTDRWKYSLDINGTIANLSQTTVFDAAGGQWRPMSGTDASMMLIKRSSKTATYDWSKGEARWGGDVKPDRSGPLPLHPGDLDAMLINLAIPRDVQAGKPLNYHMVDDGRAKQMTYRVAASPGPRPKSPGPMANDRRSCGWWTACRCPRASCSARTATTRWISS